MVINPNGEQGLSLKCRAKFSLKVTVVNNEGDPSDKFTKALARLFDHMYSSHWAHLKALHIPFKWGYDTLISNNR